jgi:hypothetical protein
VAAARILWRDLTAGNGGAAVVQGGVPVTPALVRPGSGGYSTRGHGETYETDLLDGGVPVMPGRVRGATAGRARRC